MATDARIRFYTVESLGPKQSLTPEGFLLCEEVPIARTGIQQYGPGETPLQVGPDGIINIERTPKEVFRPETIASVNGKPIVNEHPDEWVTPDNWKDLALGVVLNPRRGEGTRDDLLLADLLIKDKEAIELVQGGKRQVSCGYDCDYELNSNGRGHQTKIVVNHVALVDSARCGHRCSIQDSALKKGEKPVAQKKSWMQKVRDAWKAKDEDAMEEAMQEAPGHDDDEEKEKDLHSRMADMESKMKDHDTMLKDHGTMLKDHATMHKAHDADIKEMKEKVGGMESKDDNKEIEGELMEEAPVGTGDKARKAKDSSYLRESFEETMASAEIIAPGIRLPKFTMDAAPHSTLEVICGLRRKAIQFAVKDSYAVVEEVRGGRPLLESDISKLTCSQTRDLFNGIAAIKRNRNNNDTAKRTLGLQDGGGTGVKGPIRTPADLNKRMSTFYSSTKQ